MVLWGDSFWGEGNRGFEVLSSNVKNGAIAIEEFQRFLTESVQCESTYCKSLSRLQSQLIKTQHVGTFTPIWSLIRDLFDKISLVHLTNVNFYQDLLRDIHNYQELYQKKLKTHIQKDSDIIRSTDLITQLNYALNNVNKAKEQYQAIALDFERAKRGGNNSLTSSSTSISQDNNLPGLAQTAINSLAARHIERLEKKTRQSQDEYKSTIEKYNSVRNDYEKRYYDACTKFQDFEINHIEKMLIYSLNYSEIFQRNNEQIRQAENEFHVKLKSFTGNDLLDTFVEQKKTGSDRPGKSRNNLSRKKTQIFFSMAILQFEEVDNLKTSIQLINSNTSDLLTGQEEIGSFEHIESDVPSFEAHFSVQSPPTSKNIENNRARSPNSSHNHLNSPTRNPAMFPHLNTKTPLSPTSPMTRSQDTGDQIPNPFDVKIKRTKFPGFFGSNRKDKKGKKTEKKTMSNTKSNKTSQAQQRDESSSVNRQHLNKKNSSIDDLTQTSSNNPAISELSAKSSLPVSNNDTNHHRRKTSFTSSSSNDSSDDDDDPVVKIDFKINPKSQLTSNPTATDEDDETKISNAMRLVQQNLGHFATNSRGLVHKTSDINKSVSSGQIGAKIPPPVPLRPSTAVPNSDVDSSHDAFEQSFAKSMDIGWTNQENLSVQQRSTIDKNTTSFSSTDDDTEVANSFPLDNSTNKTTPFPILQVPSLRQSNQQQSGSSSISPSISAIIKNFSNSPISFGEQRMSPFTIGSTDQTPLAIAFQETIHVMMSGDNQENWKSRIVGEMLISFPASMLSSLVDPSRITKTLEFRLKNSNNIKNINLKSSFITQNEISSDSDEPIYSFNMIELNNVLRNLQEKNSSSPFFNLSVLNYEIKQENASSIPVQVSSQWTRTFDTISVNINYRFNSSALPESIRLNDDTVIFYTIISDGQQIKESSPIAEWSLTEHKLWWKVPYTTDGTGSLSATVQTNTNENEEQPISTSSMVNVYFLGENALVSAVDFDLTCPGYRISLLKKKILCGKYQSEPDRREPVHLFQRPIILPSPVV